MRSRPAVLLLLTASVSAQNPRTYEVASIKPADQSRPASISRSGNRMLFTNYLLERLILWAFDLSPDRLFSKPPWLGSALFDIAAAAPAGGQKSGELQSMMRSLLAERFGLQTHNETRRQRSYEMKVDRGGLKVAVRELTGPMEQNPFHMAGIGQLTGTEVNADMLANVLSERASRVVRNATGITGVFDFHLTWREDQAGDADSADAPSLFTAVREQLGLRSMRLRDLLKCS